MTRKFREFKKSLIQETARVKLYKSGKSWVKASIREFHFLKALGLSFLSHDIVKNEEGEVTVAFGDKVKQQALRTTAIAGGMFTVNMLHDQQAFAASDAPLTSEISTKSQTVGDQTSITIEKSTSGDSQSQQGVESERNADSEATPVSTHQTNAASSESTSRLSASQSASMSTSDSKSASTSESDSRSVSASTSASDAAKAESESSQSNQDETSQSASSESESKSTEKDTKVVSQQHQASAVVQNISSTSIDSRTNHRNDSLSQIKNEAKNESLAQSPFSATQSPDSAVQRVNIQPRSAQGYSGFRAAGDSTANSNVLPRRDKSKPFTERSKVLKVYVDQATGYNPYAPIYSKTVIYSDGKTMEIFNLISLDNPNTSNIEKNGWPAQQQNNAIKNTATHANNPKGKLKLGSGYGKPTIQQGAWDVNAKTWIGGTSQKAALGDARSGYYWDAAQYQKYMADKGYGIAAWIHVPIKNPNGDLSWTFHPNAEYKSGAFNRSFTDLFEDVYHEGKDPYYAWLKSPEGSASLSQSTSKVQASESRSRSIVQSIEDSRSQSISDSESTVKSKSLSTYNSQSLSTSKSIADSKAASTAKSRSISTSQSIADSKAASTA
ncbi:hypothetical protein EON06_11085, partial [Staphylococcus delphini]|uniref:KxYKxGKxW signal peptide domain-containing protein n=1 Tax=Staphylococcus delphini TaxID=53344 RepID=UPI00191C01B9